MTERTIMTEDGKTVREGDRVFNYYDGWWGTLGPIDDGGWADVHGENKRAYLNGQRLSTFDPKGSVDPQSLTLDIPAANWSPNKAMDDPLTHLTVTVTIAGTPMFVEAWEVRNVPRPGDTRQEPVSSEFEDLFAELPGDGPFVTTTINGREYVLVATPHNE